VAGLEIDEMKRAVRVRCRRVLCSFINTGQNDLRSGDNSLLGVLHNADHFAERGLRVKRRDGNVNQQQRNTSRCQNKPRDLNFFHGHTSCAQARARGIRKL
jgi:hypothetical protein